MDYTEVTCTLAASHDPENVPGIVVALLAELGFESFEESADEVKAYMPAKNFVEASLLEFTKEYPALIASINIRQIEQENWNLMWESNFPMTEVAGRVAIHAPFHTNVPELEYCICILPQMSFGTGHHETTALMIESMLDIDVEGKSVLDMGCGTGILAIFAAIKKARSVMAVDVDEWPVKNAVENSHRNGISTIQIVQGDSSLLAGYSFDLILANINRNVLLADMTVYALCIPAGGLLQLSGFYTSDLPDITAEAQRNGLTFVRSLEKNNWVAALYQKC